MPWIGFIFEAIGFAAGTAATISTFVLSTLASVAIGQVAKLFRPKASPTDASSLTRQQSGQSITSRQAAAPRRVLFGTNGNFAGIITFMCVDGNWLHLVITLTGHQVSAIRKMFFDGVEVPLSGADGDLSRTGASNYAGYVNFEAGLGTRNQAAFASLIGIGGWTSAHRQRGCAAVHVSLCWNQSLFPNGLPNITFAVDGALVYDPRNGTRAFSKNAALCTAEYLTNATWGLGAQTKAALTGAQVSNSGMGSFSAGNCVNGDLTATAWSTDAATSGAYVLVDLGSAPAAFQRCRLYLDAANYAGTYQIEWADGGGYTAVAPVFAPDVIGWNEIDLAPAGAHRYWRIRLTNTPGGGAEIREIEYYTSDVDTTALVAAANTSDEDVNLLAGGSEKRYTCNGSFDTSELPRDVIPRLNSALGGGTLYQSGRWGIYPGVWPGASLALGDGDLRAPISVQTRVPHAELFNGVKGLFLSPTNNWQLSDFPPYAEAGYLAEDANEAIWTDVEFPFTTSGATVQRLSKMMLHRRRQQISFTGQFKLQAWQVQPYDVVTFTHARFGWVNKTFEVQTCDLVYGDDPENPVVGVNLKLVELDSTVFDWSTADEDALNTPPVPALPAPGTVAAPTGLAANTFQTTRVADGVSVSGVRLTWTSPADINVTTGGTIIVQYKKHADANWIDWGPCDGASVQSDVVPLVDGTQYDFQIWAENIYGAKSAIVSTTKIPTATQVTVDTIGDGVGFYRSPKGILYSSDLPYNAGFDLFADTATLAEGWDNFAGNAASYTRNGAPYSGLYAQNLSNVGGISGYTASKPFGVKPGLTYVLGARVKASSPNVGNLGIVALFFSDDADQSYAGWVAQGTMYGSVTLGYTANPNNWAFWEGEIEVPATAKFCRIGLSNSYDAGHGGAGTAGILTFDLITWRLEQVLNPIDSGALTPNPGTNLGYDTVVAEMTSPSIQFFGGKILVIFSGNIQSLDGSEQLALITLYRNGSPILTPMYCSVGNETVSQVAITFMDDPGAGNHIYQICWRIVGVTAGIFMTDARRLQVVEQA